MNPWIKRGGIALGALIGTVIVLAGAGLLISQHKMGRQILVKPHPIDPRTDAVALERGRYLFNSRGCAECHGDNGAGKIVIQDANGMLVKAPNISPGPGSVVAHYQPADWDRAIRHGARPSGTPLMIMPSEDYNRLTDDDLAALVGYLREMPPEPGTAALLELPLPVRVLYGLGVVQDAAQKIDHSLPPGQPIPEGLTPEHGRYVAQMCMGCHGAHLSGGKIPGAPPDWPAAANLTPGDGSVLPRYANAQAFAAMMRSGKRPDGSAISPVMPFGAFKSLNDTDAQALYVYLKTATPYPAGER